ncbi:ATP-dependent DNA helicase PIF1 [Orchesella cincta]|uniref:ATP-dependent DNA helicase PIF1 n=1 Tax=Orchesella cincta TaxID=48709 RepID=A0A1D2MNM8_ORCCI|nr:ATP-dependent DNA helicase PIF1 [Orchesella cincta]
MTNLLDYYAMRPENMEEVTLAEFASMYNVSKINKSCSSSSETAAQDFSNKRQSTTSNNRVDQFLPPRFITTQDYHNMMRELNEKQRRLVLDLMHRLKRQETFYIFLSGGTASDAQKTKFLEYAKTLTVQQCSGLRYEVNLQVGAEYFISTNVDVSDGLFNGATGTLKLIEYGLTREGIAIPKRVWMDFKNPQIGITKRHAKRAYQVSKGYDVAWVPIERITMRISLTGRNRAVELIRTQIPLVAANAMTINKAQGSTIRQVVVSVRRNLSREQMYVACSRASSKIGLYIDGIFNPPNKPDDKKQQKVSSEMTRLRGSPLNMTIRFLQDYDDSFLKLYVHNIESYLRHFADLFADNCTKASDIIGIIEPQLLETDQLHTAEFEVAHRVNCSEKRNSEGVLLLKKNETEVYDIHNHTLRLAEGHCFFLTWKIGIVTFVLTYKSPKFSKRVYMENLASIIDGNEKVVVFGDININVLDGQSSAFMEVMKKFGMSSVLNLQEYTTNGLTNIDVCFTNLIGVSGWIYESLYSYHKPLCILIPKKICEIK